MARKTVKVSDVVSEEDAAANVNLSAFLSRRAQYTFFDVWLVGDMPLIVHAWSQKAKIEMLQKQVKAITPAKEQRDPEADFRSSLYAIAKDKYGFPAMGVKNAIVSCAHKDKGLPKTVVQSALWVDSIMARQSSANPGAVCDMPLMRLYGAKPEMREDMVRVGAGMNKTASLAFRAQFTTWAIKMTGKFNSSVLTMEALEYLLLEAGTQVGIGEWRPEKKGPFGTFHVATAKEAAAWDKFANGTGRLPVNPIASAA